MAYYGIDLGTSSCLAARLEEGFEPGEFSLRCLHDAEGEESFPSVISFRDDKDYLVGEKAQERLLSDPDSTVELVKLRLGKKNTISVLIDGKWQEKSPQEITALLLKHLNSYREGGLQNPVLTVPAFFDQSQKDATMQASKLAETTVAQLIEEPTAAVMYQIFDDYQRLGTDFFEVKSAKNVLVFDFGGGTLDLSLIRLTLENDEVKPDVLAVHGDSDLGGNGIDFVFTQQVLDRLSRENPQSAFISQAKRAFDDYFENYKENNILLFPDDASLEVKSFVFRLKRETERVKISLSSRDREKIFVGREFSAIDITRDEFEKLVFDHSDLDERIQEAIQSILKKAWGQPIHEVLLVGGSSQIPYVQGAVLESLQEVHVKEDAIRVSSDYSHAVAMGAAIQAALIAGVSVKPFHKNKCTSVLPRDILLEFGKSRTVIAESGTPYPFEQEKTLRFSIPHALSDSVPLKMMEKMEDSSGRSSEKLICDYRFYLPLYYTGDEMQISLNIDSAGLYQVQATHIPTKESVEFESHKSFSLSRKEFEDASARIASMKEMS